jgi:uncharacterized membrane protein (DUF373 family)
MAADPKAGAIAPDGDQEAGMPLREEFSKARARWSLLPLHHKFEQAIVYIISGLIALIVTLAVWNLLLKVVLSLLASGFDPTEYEVFQTLFGMIFTVIIALEFKRSLLVVVDRQSIVQVRVVILLAMLAILRKFLIIDLSSTEADKVFALSAAIVALGIVYWLVSPRNGQQQT